MSISTRRSLVAVAIGIVTLVAAYLSGANAYLRSGRLERTLSRDPDHFFVHYGSARTVWPGVVHLTGLEVHGQSRTTQWWVHLDDATMTVDLLQLLRRELAVTALDATGVAFRLRRRREAGSADSPPDQTPPIPGLLNTPAPPEKPEADQPATASWHIRLAGVTLEHLREVSIGRYRFAGEASATGGFDLHLDRRLTLDPATAAFRSGSLLVASRPLMDGAAGSIRFELPPLNPQHLQGGFLRLATARVTLHGQLDGLSFLDPYLRQVPWLELAAGPGAVNAKLRVQRGSYLPGTHVDVRPGRVTARLLDDQAWGQGTVSWDVVRNAGGDQGNLVAAFDEFQLGRPGVPRPRGHGRGLRVEITTRDLSIAAVPSPTALSVDLPPAELGDFSSYNTYLPRGAGIALRSGTGLLSANLRAAAPRWEATGTIDLRGRQVVVDVQGARLRGNLQARSSFRALPLERRLLLTQSDVELADVAPLHDGVRRPAAGWWARLHLDYAAVRPGTPVILRARLRSTLSDTRPLFAVFAPQHRAALSWLDRLLDLHPIDAVGELTGGDGYFEVENLVVTSGSADLRASLRLSGGRSAGILYAAYGPLSVGIELRSGQRSWKLVGARHWYENHPKLGTPVSSQPAR